MIWDATASVNRTLVTAARCVESAVLWTNILLPQHYQLDLVPSLLDDPNGIIDIAGRLGIDGHDLVILADTVAGGLACGKGKDLSGH